MRETSSREATPSRETLRSLSPSSPGPTNFPATAADSGPRPRGALRRVLRWRGVPASGLGLVSLILVAVIQPGFLTASQLTPFFAAYGPVAIIAVGVAFTLLVGGIDLSVGPVMGVCAIMTVLLSSVGTHFLSAGPSGVAALCADPGVCERGLPFALVVVIVIMVGAVFGLLNGIAISVFRLQPLVATLAMGFVAAGLSLYLMPQPGGQMPQGPLTWYSGAAIISVPLELLVLYVVLAAILMRTPLGVRMRAVGSHRWKAFTSGIAVNRISMAAYVASGTSAAVAGVLLTLNSGSADPSIGVEYTLTAVAGAVLGGTALRGGWADPFGPAIGVLTLGLLSELVTVAKVPTYYAQLTTGIIILGGLTVTQVLLRRSNRTTS